ncbi:MAG: M48 family metallopeptidase [Anaerolineales bacterium]|nr:M48 family metallopeptidase [Anaerolineales bacterium]
MTTQIQVEDILVDVQFKRIKRMNLRVQAPHGAVRVSAPAWVSLGAVQRFVAANLAWIRKQQKRFEGPAGEAPLRYLDGETLYLWGRPYPLRLAPRRGRGPAVQLGGGEIVLGVGTGSSRQKRAAQVAAWYREQLRGAALPLIAKWEPAIGRRMSRLAIQQMKTRWGSCNTANGAIRLNTELAKRPPHLLEYVVVHELVHLIEPSHNQVFKDHMTRLMPQWREYRRELNRAGPVNS